MYIGLQVECRLLIKFEFKYSNKKFNETPSSGSRVVPCGRDSGQTDMTKLIVGFHSFTNAPKLNLNFTRQIMASKLTVYLWITYIDA
jgi:hypothetical protein